MVQYGMKFLHYAPRHCFDVEVLCSWMQDAKNPSWQPVTVMIAKFNEQYAINNHVPRIMAGSVMLIIPVLIIYGLFQRWIIESMMFSAVKE